MANRRDDFKAKTKRVLADRAGHRCSAPSCSASTVGASSDSFEAVASAGDACHITAASPRGPRYDGSLTQEQRRSAANGIWLCATHARIVDRDPARFPVDLLRRWKRLREDRARRDLGTPVRSSRYPHAVLFEELVASVEASAVLEQIEAAAGLSIELEPADLQVFDAFGAHCTGAREDGLVELRLWTPDGVLFLGAGRADARGCLNLPCRLPYHPNLKAGQYIVEAREADGARFATPLRVVRAPRAPALRVRPESVPIGGEVLVEGSHFPPEGHLQLFFYDRDGRTGAGIGEAISDAEGSFRLRVRTPHFHGGGVVDPGEHPVRAHAFSCIGEASLLIEEPDPNATLVRRINQTKGRQLPEPQPPPVGDLPAAGDHRVRLAEQDDASLRYLVSVSCLARPGVRAPGLDDRVPRGGTGSGSWPGTLSSADVRADAQQQRGPRGAEADGPLLDGSRDRWRTRDRHRCEPPGR